MGHLWKVSKVATKMVEQAQVQQQVTMKDPKKVEAGKILAEYNCRKREQLAKLTYYGAGAVVDIGMSGILHWLLNIQ